MSDSTEDSYTILKYIDVDLSARVYRNDQLWCTLEDDSMDENDDSIHKFELLLEKAKTSFRSLYLFTEDSEVMFDLAFSDEWKEKPLSEILKEADQRDIETIVQREVNF